MKSLECALAAVIMKSDPTLIRVDHSSRDGAIDSAPDLHTWPSRASFVVDHTSQLPPAHQDEQSITSSETIKAIKSVGLDSYAQNCGKIAGTQSSQSGECQMGTEEVDVGMGPKYSEQSDESTYLHVQSTVNCIVPSPSLD